MSLRKTAKAIGVDHSTLSKVLSGKYPANAKNVVEKILNSINGIIIPADKYEDLLQMLDKARFPAKFGSAQRTATWLWDQVHQAKRNSQKAESDNG